jgi:hypothetical protein
VVPDRIDNNLLAARIVLEDQLQRRHHLVLRPSSADCILLFPIYFISMQG